MNKIISHLSESWGAYLALIVYLICLYHAYKYAAVEEDFESGGYDE